MSMRRVVVTGMGVVSPLGLSPDYVWSKLINGASGISKITSFDVSDLPSHIAGQIPLGNYSDFKYNPEEWMPLKEAKRNDKFIVYSIAAATQAVKDSNLYSLTEAQKLRAGVNIGSGIGGLSTIYETSVLLEKGEYRKISPFFIPAALINLAPGIVSIKFGLKGPNISITTACATGAHSIGDSFWTIRNDQADIMLAGGSESAVCKLGIAGFSRMNALSTKFNDQPEKASRPWDKDRDGFVISEGSAILVLEELEHAKNRGANIYAELVGFGSSGDASHITSPSGDGALLCMKNALKSANISYKDINYINAHGTSTAVGDEAELMAVKELFKEHIKNVKMSSTKSSVGHMLGAAGAFEALVAVKACMNDIVPPTLNLDNPIDDCGIDFIPHKSKETKVNYVLSNSFGFGGTNASLIFKKANI